MMIDELIDEIQRKMIEARKAYTDEYNLNGHSWAEGYETGKHDAFKEIFHILSTQHDR